MTAAVSPMPWDSNPRTAAVTRMPSPSGTGQLTFKLTFCDQFPSPVSAGTFVVDPVTGEAHVVFRADKPVNAIAKFAVSLERKGGVPKPEGPIVLISQ